MDIKIDAAGALSVSGILDINTAGAFRDALLNRLRSGLAVDLNLSAVESCDAVAWQLLYSARVSAAQRNLPFRIAGLTVALAQAASDLGLSLDELTPDIHEHGAL